MLMSGVVCQRRTPDPTGREADEGGINNRGDGDGEAKAASWENEGGEPPDATDSNWEQSEGERKGR